MNQEKLKELLHYDPDTGIFTNRVYRGGGCLAGDTAGWTNDGGYAHIKIAHKTYKLHRLAFLYMTGEWPPNDVDHENRDCADNRWSNLRAVTKSENQRNAKMRCNNTSGTTGVSWYKRTRKWRVRICTGEGMQQYLGHYDSLLDAVAARLRAERELGYHKNHGRNV